MDRGKERLAMSSGLSSTLSEFTRKSDFAKNPLAGETAPAARAARRSSSSLLSRLGTGIKTFFRKLVSWPIMLVSSNFMRYLLAFMLGAAALLGWQTWGNTARRTVASWSPRLAFVAPASARGITPDQMQATSRALAAVHQSVDKLSSEISRMEAQGNSDTVAAAAAASERRKSKR
jgi:hypothetical protein